jgi:hypothetical protein
VAATFYSVTVDMDLNNMSAEMKRVQTFVGATDLWPILNANKTQEKVYLKYNIFRSLVAGSLILGATHKRHTSIF